jgi:hypothetical protein
MIGARNVSAGVNLGAGPAYTVVPKSGQRGIQFSDPVLAAEAFARASEKDRPFVLRHRGERSIVIADTRRGRKLVSADRASERGFCEALRFLETQAK